ncbi:uncharacterized protein LOC116286517 [Actinia tenebrosa]|uniref:Uncharacterized protein LOC116286517 n=1 Tax=Actinia tenebrosa TaxID=6105 RepID=A0A6P8GXC7_ACTTE|nr:uncharacterized protein LOC116286517 [Actinia tenebrosa]XP_031548929.1 uncharacterized protein LOC116286517 [Actinia tenebrosa]
MEDTIMEVNLCPFSNFGQASCSVHTGSEDASFSKIENQAIVRLEHSVTVVCPENGEIQYTTTIPDKNIGHSGQMLSKTSLTVDHNVNKFEFRTRNNILPMVHKSLLQKHTVDYRTGLDDIADRSRVLLPGRGAIATSGKLVHEVESSRSRKRKNTDRLDPETEDGKKPRKNKQWTETSMQRAMTAVRNGMRVRRAAKEFAVPRTTLKYKLNGRTPLSHNADSSTNKLKEKIPDMTKEYVEAKKAKRESPPPQGKQLKDQISLDAGQKSAGTNKSSVVSCEESKIESSSFDIPVQHTRSLRSNSHTFEKKVAIPLEKVAERTKKSIHQQVNKCAKETNTSDLKQKNSKTNQFVCHKDLKSRNEQKVSKEEGMKYEGKKCFKLWSEEMMKKAIHAVQNGSKIREAANKFGIPRSTLGRRLSVAAFEKSYSLSKSDLQANVSGAQLVGVRQSPRRQKTSPVQDTAQKDPAMQPSGDKKVLDTTRENKSVEEAVNVNTPAEDKDDAAKTKGGRHKTKAWSEETMEKALEAVEQGMSFCSAAKRFNLPTASLTSRKYKRDRINTRNAGPKPHINPEDEDQIVKYVNDCAMIGIVNIKQVGLLLTAEAAEKRFIWDIKKQGLPSDDWWNAFCSRRGSQFKNVDMMQPHQRIKLTEAKLSLFYDKLSAIKNSSKNHKALVNCSDCRTFTVQEFKYDLDTVTHWVSHGEDTFACRRPEHDPENKLVSAIVCASAAGNSIPPMFVYHTDDNYKIPATGLVGPFGAVHFVHDVHDLTRKSDFYFKWFEEVFLKNVPKSRPLILLFDPDTAFITPEFIQLAQKNEIILLGLPPLSAHITQPLNRTVLPALKEGFTFTSSLFKRIFVKGVNFNNFARCFKAAWNSSVDAAIIKTGFAEAGIHPIDRNIILKSKAL